MIADYIPSDRQVRTGIDLLAAIVVVSVAFALAGLTWRIAGHAGTGAITVPSAGRPVALDTDIGPALALEPFGKPALGAADRATDIDATLNGVIFARPATLSTAFIRVGNEPSHDFAIGDRMGGARIEAIRRDRVILNNGGTIEYLAFPDPTRPEDEDSGSTRGKSGSRLFSSPSRPSRPSPSPSPTAASGEEPPSANSVMSRLDATPTDNGYQIGDNAPAGLQSGDVVQSVNGQAVTDQSAARAAFAGAARSGKASIKILRDGKTITLTVPTR